jgi:5'-methylthioadenosine phosphorylase
MQMADELIGIIGGSGLGDGLAEHITSASSQQVDTPFGSPSGPVILGTIGKRKVAFLNRHGDGHTIPPSAVPYQANIFALKKLGATAVIASGAVGSLKGEIVPKDLVVVSQFIDKTYRRKGSFFDDFGAVHSELAEPVCGGLSRSILSAAANINATAHDDATYVCMEGPQFSTRAESLMHKQWGGDLIGMTAMPEAKLAREAQMCYALIALASDYDCWKEHDRSISKQALLEEIIGNLTTATNNAIRLIKKVLELDEPLCDKDCACRKSLALAVWTKPDVIDQAKRNELEVLFK